MNNLLRSIAVGTVIAVCTVGMTTGCTSSGQHLSKYKDLNIHLNYTETFHLQPAARSPEYVYVNIRDLSGGGLDGVFSSRLIPKIASQPNIAIVNTAADADIVIYGTISSANSTSNQSTGGVVAGTVIGAATGGVIAAIITTFVFSFSADSSLTWIRHMPPDRCLNMWRKVCLSSSVTNRTWRKFLIPGTTSFYILQNTIFLSSCDKDCLFISLFVR